MREVFANLFSLETFADKKKLQFLEENFEGLFSAYNQMEYNILFRGEKLLMYVARCDMEYMREHKVLDLRKKYKEKFGEPFISFNYIDFPRQGEKCSAQVYKETLEKALEGDKPYHIVSHRFDFIDH